MKLSKKIRSCLSSSSVQVIPSIAYQQGEGKDYYDSKKRSSLAEFESEFGGGRFGKGRLSDNINELTALVTDERMDGAIQQSEGETLSLADSLMDRCDEDLQWHRQQKNGGGERQGDKRISLLEQQQSDSLRPAPPQSKIDVAVSEGGAIPIYERETTYPETLSESSSEDRFEQPSSPPLCPELKMMSEPGDHISPTNWGYPGYLSSSEYDVYLQFRSEISKRAPVFRDTIFCFGYDEEEPYALCRWLRARKFDFEKVVQMVEQAIECAAEASKHDFYEDASKALGVEPTIYFSLYPELFCGFSKQGCPLYITRAGECDIRKVLSVTTERNIINFHWHCMKIAFGRRLANKKRSDPNVHRFEGFAVFDMAGLSIQGCLDAMNIFKAQTNIDQLCFPESLNRFIVINAPSAFSVIWRIVKTLVDARTAAKVEIFASRKHVWQKRLQELVSEHELPSDYGGRAPSTQEVYRKQTTDAGLARQFTIPISTKEGSAEQHDIFLQEGESLELIVFTKSTKPGTLTVSKVDDNSTTKKSTTSSSSKSNFEVGRVNVKHQGEGVNLEEEEPTRVSFPLEIKGPGKFNISLSCTAGKEVFTIVGKVRDNASTHCNDSFSGSVLPVKHQKSIESNGKIKQMEDDDDAVGPVRRRSMEQDPTMVWKEPQLLGMPPTVPFTDDVTSEKVQDSYWDSSCYSSSCLLVPSKTTSILSMPAMPPARAIYTTFSIVMFIMMHDFWLMWALSQERALCD